MARTSRALAAFLPAHLIEDLAADPGGGVPLESRFEAALLLSDISGFTALTERLEGRGRQGAEEIAAIVSNAFRPAITSIRRFGGSIVSFGGDAIFSVFRGAGRVRDALAAAQEIRESFGSRAARPGAPAIGISQAVHCGPVRAIHVGVEGARHQVLTGSCVQGLARLQKRARAGEILVSPRARRERARTRRLAPELSLPDVARRYLPRSLIDRLARGSGEYHAASVLFLETRPMAAAALQRFFAALDRSLCDLEGMFLKSDLCADGVRWLCVFGIAKAHEDDAARAARLWMDVASSGGISDRIRGGLHAGTLVSTLVGTAWRRALDVMGDVPNTAARAASQAAWGEVLVTEPAARMLRGFRLEHRGARAVKGKAGPLALWSLRGTSARAERGPTTPLVGREREMEILRLAIARSAAGDGQIVEIEGEAGLGKSRLKWEAARLARDHGLDVHEGRAISFAGMSYWTIADLVRSTLAVAPDAAAAEAGARMRDAAADLGIGPLETDHLLDVLAARPASSPIRELDARTVRARNRESVVAYLRAISRRRPRMIALEDLHHADELTRDVVSALGPAAAGAPLFVLLCHRPGFEPPPGAVRLPLAEIPERDLQALLVASLHGREIGREVVERVLARAEGNPFYVEEMARHLLETDRSPASDDLPGTITALLQARLDTLSPAARSAAQLASVLGRSFPKELLVHLLGRRSRSDAILEELASRQLVLPATSGDELIFRHALTRDVAYGSVLLRRRASLHRRVARAVEDRYGAEPAAYLPMMAHHWEHAGDVVRARARYLDAGEAALARYAHGEAERLLRAHIALAPRPDKASIHARHQLGARVLRFLGRIEEALAEHERGLADARLAGDGPGEINHITATANVFLVQGRKREARALHEQALRMADAGGHRVNRAVCIANLAAIAKDLGDVVEAERLGWEAIAVQRELGDAHQLAIALNNLATLFDEQGRRDESLALAEESLAIFERAGERRLAGIVGANLAGVYLELGDGNRARAAFETSRRIAAEIGDVIAEGSALSGLASVEESCGNRSLAIARSRMALACAVRSGDVRLHAWVLSSLGAQEVDGDELEMAARHFEEAERLIERLSDPSLLARLRVFQGRLVLAQGRDPAPLLEEARRLAGEIGARPGSQIQDAIERLDAAARERSA